jgi:hypothetical protein
MYGRSWYRVMNDWRETTLDFAASAAEGYASWANPCGCGQQGCARCSYALGPHSRGSGDFLADWIRLNVEYMSQVARLGSAYTFWATRVLDRIYSDFGRYDDRGPLAVAELAFEGRMGSGASREATVRNNLGRKASFTVKDNKGGYLELEFTDVLEPSRKLIGAVELLRDGKMLADGIELEPGGTAAIVVSVMKGLDAGRSYRGCVKTDLGGQAGEIRLFIKVLP